MIYHVVSCCNMIYHAKNSPKNKEKKKNRAVIGIPDDSPVNIYREGYLAKGLYRRTDNASL